VTISVCDVVAVAELPPLPPHRKKLEAISIKENELVA
jgi:hypothetical protein